MSSGWFKETPETRRLLAEELALVDAAELVAEALERRGVTRTDLAKRLKVKLSEISQRLSGKRNVTLRNLAAALHVLDYDLALGARDRVSGRMVPTRTTRHDLVWDLHADGAAGEVGSAAAAVLAGWKPMTLMVGPAEFDVAFNAGAGLVFAQTKNHRKAPPQTIKVALPGIENELSTWLNTEDRVDLHEVLKTG